MKIGELFVSLGVKGSDSAAKALKNTKDGLGEVKSMGLETKAAIAAVVYGLERMMSQSAQAGTGLMNFSNLTGISAKTLQQWQFAARQANVSGEEMAGNMKAVQASIASMLQGSGPISGLSMVADKVGLDENRLRDIPYVLGQLQKFAQMVPADVGNDKLKSFGLSENIISAMRQNAFRPEVFKKAPTYSEKDIASLNQANVAWANLGAKVERAFGQFTAAHGTQLVDDLSKLATEVFRLADALMKIAEAFGLFKGINAVAKYIAETAGETASNIKNSDKASEIIAERMDPKNIKSFAELISKIFKYGNMTPTEIVNEKNVGPRVAPAGGNVTHISAPITNHFQHDGKDAKKLGDATHKSVNDAFRQMPAARQGG